ncbi:MAG: putative 7-carboxy-7-deazaguanine synthase QueE [Lachnospiraceae bacterium]|nr:putative 7-carboxy-7-deazaguanine synthase QueE [Lachnospiraceae bacterium]
MDNKYDRADREIIFPVAEHFISINGEGRHAGQLAMFIRFAGCNLNCEYCDTKWANEEDVEYESIPCDLLLDMIDEADVDNITITGGEPLLQPGIRELLEELRAKRRLKVEIETNGSIDIRAFFPQEEAFISDNVSFTLDYKTGASGMEEHMCLGNYENARECDTVKFVVGSIEDLEKTRYVIDRYKLIDKKCGVYISPCFGRIEPSEIVEYLIAQRMNGVNVQLQMHKYIWNPTQRGV